ncbi:2-dehydropantoate 2-reductase [Epidermidibacterium keratini]|uniref:2-dehydropantoate 2-reductase n=1 Tax=Epidermidibacterium keratini TaxID=1891644 RepID=A0A7L4YKK8_9ACTN|nr:2-dehydropantoate 2-reductase [Epidermidibacterium keratini]QHB99780.1 2-dehydropantoate 2-reductase [Epidermidibacterium keratini]
MTRVVVYGAGAVGGVIAGNLAAGGVDVAVVARGEHLAAIRRDGLQISSAGGTSAYPVVAVDDPASLGLNADDIVLIAVKSNATDSVAQRLREVAPPDLVVASVQNSVVNEPLLSEYFDRVYGVCVMLPAMYLEPGQIVQRSYPTPGILDVGRIPTGIDAESSQIAQLLQAGGFASEPREDIMAWKRRKLVMNLANAVDAVCEPGEDAATLRRLVRDEGEQVLDASGLSVISAEQDAERRGDLIAISREPGVESGSSTWQSLRRGTGETEAAYLNGEIVRLAATRGLSARANELMAAEADRLAREGLPPRSVPAADLLALLGD